MLYSHGFIYFLRDYLLQQIAAQQDAGICTEDLTTRLTTLNSKISAYEQQQCQSNAR